MGLQLVNGDTPNLPSFLDYLYGGLEGYVAGATKRVLPDGNVEFKRKAFVWPQEKDDIRNWVFAQTSTAEVYLAPAVFSEASGLKEHFKATNVVWSEFDGALPTVEQMGSIPPPTLRVRSSGEENEHWYWRLESPLTEAAAVESINRALAYQLGADVSGWDANQVLRPIGTHNHKRDKPVVLVSQSDTVVSPIQFDVLPAYEPQHVEVEFDVIPDVADVIFKYVFPQSVADLYRSKVEPGTDRSAMLMRLGYYLAEMGLSDNEMFAVLRNADDRWGKFKDRTDRDRRLIDLIGKARQKYPVEIILPDDAVPIYGLLSFLNTEVEIEWVIPGLLQAQGYMLLTGPAGVGKTQFSLRWAINLALGRSFLGHEIAKPYRILFWSMEMGHPDLKFFLSTMCQGMSQDDLLLLEQNLLIAPLGESFYLDMTKTQEQFKEIISEFKPDGVFLDSMGSSASGAITDESTVRAIMDFNDVLRQRYGVFTWFIHHMRKAQGDNKKPNKQSDVYGNIYLVNRATSVYCLWPSGSSIDVIPLKKRLAAMEEPWQITRYNNLDFSRKAEVKIKAPTTNVLSSDPDSPTPTGISDI